MFETVKTLSWWVWAAVFLAFLLFGVAAFLGIHASQSGRPKLTKWLAAAAAGIAAAFGLAASTSLTAADSSQSSVPPLGSTTPTTIGSNPVRQTDEISEPSTSPDRAAGAAITRDSAVIRMGVAQGDQPGGVCVVGMIDAGYGKLLRLALREVSFQTDPQTLEPSVQVQGAEPFGSEYGAFSNNCFGPFGQNESSRYFVYEVLSDSAFDYEVLEVGLDDLDALQDFDVYEWRVAEGYDGVRALTIDP